MKTRIIPTIALILLLLAAAPAVLAADCVECHRKTTPQTVIDWEGSRHADNDIDCDVCHGQGHNSETDVADVSLPTPDTCNTCHEDQVAQYKRGKHAVAWAAMKAMPTIHWQAPELIDGMKGCGGCHKIGLKSDEEIRSLKEGGSMFGHASCDACHTRHLFSAEEARQPEACRTCHMGFDHPQWEMYSSSKHGVRYQLKSKKVLPETAAAPTCQTCHMQDGNHENRTAWGFLAVRLPLPEDKQWAADQVVILQGLGVLDPEGNPTGRLDVVKAADVARLTQEDFDRERNKMLDTCGDCHSENFAKAEVEKGDRMIQQVDRLLAEAITIVADLYKDGVLEKRAEYANAFPDLLTFHDSPTPIENRLFVMYLKHRMRAFQGTFHANPDYALWYGWSEMKRDITDIRAMAKELRKDHQAEGS